MNDILEITPGIPLMLSSTSKGDAMKWYQPETNCYLKANSVTMDVNIKMPLQKSSLRALVSCCISLSCNIISAAFA